MHRAEETAHVLAIGLPAEGLAALAALGATIVTTVPAPDTLALVVTTPTDRPPAGLTEVPWLVLVDADADAPAAVEAGADYALAASATPTQLAAVYLAARREAAARLARRSSASRSDQRDGRHHAMMANAGDAILITDYASARFVEVNPAACALFGYTPAEFLQLTGRALGGPEAKEVVDQVARALVETGAAFHPRHPMRRKDGSPFWGAVRLSMYEYLGEKQYLVIVRDVTAEVEVEEARARELERSQRELAAAQRALVHSSRLAALGQMAAGVAHEINNPLQFILAGFDELELAVSDAAAETRQVLADMRDGDERIRLVTRSLLPFARVEVGEPERVELNELVQWACRMTANDIRHRAQLERHLGPVPAILGHRTRLGQLITNLLTNAAHAIEEGASERHRITVTTELVADRVHLTVADTGRGIAEELRPRIFDPFFTTKPRDLGTGLGLALCAEIVGRYGGTIDFTSEVGRGTSFVVTFPVLTGTPVEAGPATALPRAAGGRRILVIDDEEVLLRTYQRALRGYDVVTALGGAAAIAALTTDAAFDAVVCDLMMERILFCSGGAFTPRVREFLASVPNVVLDKPIGSAQLREAVEAAIAAHPS
jgi:PAS domain S-box-containing protein